MIRVFKYENLDLETKDLVDNALEENDYYKKLKSGVWITVGWSEISCFIKYKNKEFLICNPYELIVTDDFYLMLIFNIDYQLVYKIDNTPNISISNYPK